MHYQHPRCTTFPLRIATAFVFLVAATAALTVAEWVCYPRWYKIYYVDLTHRFDAGYTQVRSEGECMRDTADKGYDAAVFRSDLGRCYFKDTRGYGSHESFEVNLNYLGRFHVPGYDSVWQPSLKGMLQWLSWTDDPCHMMTRVGGEKGRVTCKVFDGCPSGGCVLIMKSGEDCRNVGRLGREDGRNATTTTVAVTRTS